MQKRMSNSIMFLLKVNLQVNCQWNQNCVTLIPMAYSLFSNVWQLKKTQLQEEIICLTFCEPIILSCNYRNTFKETEGTSNRWGEWVDLLKFFDDR